MQLVWWFCSTHTRAIQQMFANDGRQTCTCIVGESLQRDPNGRLLFINSILVTYIYILCLLHTEEKNHFYFHLWTFSFLSPSQAFCLFTFWAGMTKAILITDFLSFFLFQKNCLHTFKLKKIAIDKEIDIPNHRANGC